MDNEQYVIEREYLGVISVKEIMSRIIKKHSDTSCEGKKSDYVRTVEAPLDL